MTMWQHKLGLDLEIPDSFGYWFAGFIDGEGCFYIQPGGGNGNGISCGLHITLRDDDFAVLYEIEETLGVGRLYHRKVPLRLEAEKRKENPGIRWAVHKTSDIIHVIIPLLEKYPLHAKKKRDFVLWVQAARIIHVKGHHTSEGRAEVLRLKTKMETERKYDSSLSIAIATHPAIMGNN